MVGAGLAIASIKRFFLIARWAIWCHKNKVIFDGAHASLNRWKQLFRQEFQLLFHRAKSALERVGV
jgi:hypothetical protein